MSDQELRPEDDPRYLAPVKPFIPKSNTVEELESGLAYHGAMLNMFATEGWKEFSSILENRRDHAVRALTHNGGADTLEMIYGWRQQLALVDEILSFEDTSRKAYALASERLNSISDREEA